MSSLYRTDPQIARLIQAEEERQNNTLELIASENHASGLVLEAMGSVLTDKYAEGYPKKRWYCGCDNMDQVEQLAIDRANGLSTWRRNRRHYTAGLATQRTGSGIRAVHRCSP